MCKDKNQLTLQFQTRVHSHRNIGLYIRKYIIKYIQKKKQILLTHCHDNATHKRQTTSTNENNLRKDGIKK